MNVMRRFVAFAIAVVMICGMLPATTLAVETHDHVSGGDIAPFTSTADLIEQVKAQLLAEGKIYTEEPEDQSLVAAVESESGYTFEQAQTMLVMGFFNDRTGTEGTISTARLNLDEATMTALMETALKAYYLDSIVEPELHVENGVVTAIHFTMRESFAAGLDEIATGIDNTQEEEAAQQTITVVETTENVMAEETKELPFTDVPNWALKAVTYLYERGIVSGVSATKYGSSSRVTRGQAVMMIWRAMGSPTPQGKNTFTDVKDSAYYASAVIWAAENSIVSGTGTNKFSPDNNITREQLVAIMYKLAQFNGINVSEKADISGFKDAGKIATWAVEATKWAVAAGLVSGYEDGTFRPQGNATRAEYAVVLYNYLQNNHALVHVAAVPSTCSTQGNIEYWRCDSHCSKLFADAEGTQEITLEAAMLPLDPANHNPQPVPEVSPTCNSTGVAAHYKCACGLVVDGNGNLVTDMSVLTLPATGHAPASVDDADWGWTPVDVDAVDAEGNTSSGLVFDAETGEISVVEKKQTTAFTTQGVAFTCAGCGEDFTASVENSYYVMTEEWIEETTNAYAEQVATELITEYVTNKAMAYYAEHGAAPSDEQTNAWVQEASQDPEILSKVEQEANLYAYQLAYNMNSVIYTATATGEGIATFTGEVNATEYQLMKDWATMCAFNEFYSNYFGLVAPYWASKNTESSPFGAVIYMCSQEEQPLIPNANMDYMIDMLTQAFMSYVMQYGTMLDAMLEDAMAAIDDSKAASNAKLDEIDKLLLLHDWLALNGTFDMQSLVDITSGESDGNDPIAMTAFGVLLNDQIEKAEDAMWDGGVCLAYAATYALLVQQAFGLTQDDDAMIDFVKIQFLTNVADSSVAAGDSGFGDGDAMFNSAHYLNAVKLSNGEWYYIDACYDDVNTEVISQYRVETDGNISHTSFLLAPATWEEMYEDNFQYMDSLYDGKVWQRVYDGEGGYMMMDKDKNTYTQAEAEAIQAEAEENGETVQMFYYYETVDTDTETRYEDSTYEEAWFVGVNSALNYDAATGYFYYTAGAINSYSTLKDMFGDEEDGSGSSMGDTMDQEDMMEYKYDPSTQDKIVRRPVNATNEPSSTGSSYSMSQASDEYAEVLFHYGYGSIGAEAQADYDADMEDNSMTGGADTEVPAEEQGPYYDLVVDDQVYLSNYPDLVHSTVMMDGKLYFNIGNAIYTFNYDVSDMAAQAASALTTLELVKVKEYNQVSYTSNGKRFTGMSFEVSSSGRNSVTYHPVAALAVKDVITWTDADNDGYAETRNVTPTLHVSIGTNLTNSYKDKNDEAYTVEARNYNPDYYRFMEEEEDTTEDVNDNVEFMWCANLVEKMPVDEMLSDLSSGSTSTVSVSAYCAKDAFTEVRTTKYGLTASKGLDVNDLEAEGIRTVSAGTAKNHSYAADSEEGTNICSTCLEAHDHDYSTAAAEDIVITWKKTTQESSDGSTTTTKLTATAEIPCQNDEFCGQVLGSEDSADDSFTIDVNGPDSDGVYTAVAKYGTIEKTETMTIAQFDHTAHTYGDPVFDWTNTAAAGETPVWTATTATFTCTEYAKGNCALGDGKEVVEVEATVTTNNGDYTATCTGPDGKEYTETKHNFGEAEWTFNEDYTTGTATKTCVNCGTEKMTVELSVEAGTISHSNITATCAKDGTMVVDAKATFADGSTASYKKEDAVAPATGEHTYNDEGICTVCGDVNGETHTHEFDSTAEATYAWASDYSTCTKNQKCTSCGKTVAVMTVDTKEATTAATCGTDGKTTYTATFSDTDVQTKELTIPATGEHTFVIADSSVAWSYNAVNDTMTATYTPTCSGCGAKDEAQTVNAVKGEDGTWTATFYAGADNETVVKHTHDYDTNGKCGGCGHVKPAENTEGSGDGSGEGEGSGDGSGEGEGEGSTGEGEGSTGEGTNP